MPLPVYGSRDGLQHRLEDWADRLGRDKRFPWAGTGLLADLKTAADVVGGNPAKAESMEFDL